MAKNTGLGKGLDALFGDKQISSKEEEIKSGEVVEQLKITEVEPNVNQPRKKFDEESLEELAESIKQHGIIQPLVLRKAGEKYEVVAGERRFKAAGMAGLVKLPAVITDIDDNSSAEIALVENIQRKNLTSIEEARSFRNLLDQGYITQDELAKKMGLSQSAISNKLRLLNLDEEVQEALLTEKISERHARALLQLEDKEAQKNWLNKVIKERMTVRQLDMELKNILKPGEEESSEEAVVNLTPDVPIIENNVTDIVVEEPIVQNEIEVNIPKEVLSPMPNILSEEPEIKVQEAPRKFFSFVEDKEESVNMSTEEAPNAFEMQNVEPNEPIIEEQPPEPKPEESVEILDMPMPSLATQSEMNTGYNFQNTTEETTTPTNELLSPFEMAERDINEETPIVNEIKTENIVDPVSMIEKLDPRYEHKILEAAGLDLKSGINAIRQYLKTIEEKGFVIDTEEIDLEDVYQIIININKNDI